VPALRGRAGLPARHAEAGRTRRRRGARQPPCPERQAAGARAKLRRAMTGLMHDQAASVVRERDRRRLRAMAGVLCLGGLLVGGVLGYVWLHVQRVRVSYELEDLRSLRADVEEQNKKLRLELSSLRSLARVDSAARRLGLTEPARDQVRLAREVLTAASPGDVAAAAPLPPAGPGARPARGLSRRGGPPRPAGNGGPAPPRS